MDQQQQPIEGAPSEMPRSRPWSAETRRWIVVGLVILGAWLIYQVREVIPTIVLALLVAYLLNPLVGYLQRRGLPRAAAVALIYLVLVIMLTGASLFVGPALVRQVTRLVAQLDEILAATSALLGRIPLLEGLGIQVDPANLSNQLRAELAMLASSAPSFVMTAASRVITGVLVVVLSLYFLLTAHTLGESIERALPAEYRDEWRRIQSEFDNIWSAFLRGQVILATIIGSIVAVTLLVLGVRNALLLGLLAGLLEVIPNLGPIVAMIPAVLIALFQGSSRWAVDNTVFALIVVAAYFVIQQLENHLIVPKVIGSSVNLPPVVILVGALIGANLAGILGIFLAAPVLATARVVGEFVLRKLFEPEGS